jgi:hypothetical protein
MKEAAPNSTTTTTNEECIININKELNKNLILESEKIIINPNNAVEIIDQLINENSIGVDLTTNMNNTPNENDINTLIDLKNFNIEIDKSNFLLIHNSSQSSSTSSANSSSSSSSAVCQNQIMPDIDEDLSVNRNYQEQKFFTSFKEKELKVNFSF